MKHFAPQLSGSTVVSGSLTISTHTLPAENNTYDLGSETQGWRNLYATASHATTASFAGTASYAINGGVDESSVSSSIDLATGSLVQTASAAGTNITFTKGDGSAFTITVDSPTSGSYIHTQSSAALTWNVAHNTDTEYPVVTVYDSSSNVIIPEEISITDSNNLTVTMPTAETGYVAVGVAEASLSTDAYAASTASFFINATVSDNRLQFTQGNGGVIDLTVATGSGGGGGGSYTLTNTDIAGLGVGIVSSSTQIQNNLPSDIISSSAQIASEISGAFDSVSASLAEDINSSSFSLSGTDNVFPIFNASGNNVEDSRMSQQPIVNSAIFSGDYRAGGSSSMTLVSFRDRSGQGFEFDFHEYAKVNSIITFDSDWDSYVSGLGGTTGTIKRIDGDEVVVTTTISIPDTGGAQQEGTAISASLSRRIELDTIDLITGETIFSNTIVTQTLGFNSTRTTTTPGTLLTVNTASNIVEKVAISDLGLGTPDGTLSSSAQIATDISGAFDTSSFLTNDIGVISSSAQLDNLSFTSSVSLTADSASVIANVTESGAPHIRMWVGTSASYAAIPTKDDNTLYFLT